MDPLAHLPIAHASLDPIDRDLMEIDAAIGLIVGGLATRVRLVGLARPESVAPVGLARSQAAGIRFEIDRGGNGVIAMTVGPRVPGA